MLAAQMLQQTTTRTSNAGNDRSSWWWNETIGKLLPSSFTGNQSTTNTNCIIPSIEASTQQLFLQCIQYFTTHGIDQLFDRIETAVIAATDDVDLKSPATIDRLEHIFNRVRVRLEGSDARNFSYLIVALGAAQDAHSRTAHRSRLEALLHRLIDILECDDCKQVTGDIVSIYLTACSRYCSRSIVDASQPTAFAKLLPIISDSYQFVSSGEFDSPMQDSLSSNELHRFAMQVFNMPPVEVVPSVSID